MALETQGIALPVEESLDAYLITMGEVAKSHAPALLHRLRGEGITVDGDYMNKKMKAQFKAADRQNATFTLVLGDDELENGTVVLKNLETGGQENIPVEQAIEKLKAERGA
jgi:histidyl-tRNA synthetase